MGGLAAGLVYGTATSLANALSSPYTQLGMPLKGTVWSGAAKVLGLLMDAGWSWAALAVGIGWLARTWARGAPAGVLALVAASGAYYATDACVADAGGGLAVWSVVAVPFGLALGAVGAAIRRPGVTGLLAALTVPVGAAVQMLVLPPRPHLTMTPPVILAEAIVWTGAALGAGWALHRFLTTRRATAPG